jgi:CDP-diacylglycerol pyrophosphatase
MKVTQSYLNIFVGIKRGLGMKFLPFKVASAMSRHNKLGLPIILIILIFSKTSIASAIVKSDILLHIVSQCVDPSKAHYCSSCTLPRVDAQCGQTLECRQTNEVWELSPRYVAIRDIKMCGCPSTFVHGLALPRAVVTGVEDPNRQEEIWQFAWSAGVDRLEEYSIALAVNPKSERTQNQLHVHILRLNEGARQKFLDYETITVNNLDHVWEVAERIAQEKKLDDYGILVSKHSSDQFIVVVSKNSPEALFTKWKCN